VKYDVVVTPEAQEGIRSSFPHRLQGLYDRIDTLGRFPERCGFAREREYLEEDLHKVRKTVYVPHVRHARRRVAGEIEEDS